MQVVRNILFLGGVFYFLWCILIRKVYTAYRYKNGSAKFEIEKPIDQAYLMNIISNNFNFPDIKAIHFDENNNVEIVGKHNTYKFEILDNQISVVYKHPESDNKECRSIEEAIVISKYLQKELCNSPINPYDSYESYKNGKKRRTIFLGVIAIVFVVFIGYVFYTELGDSVKSSQISEQYLSEFSEEITIGEAFDSFFDNTRWVTYEIGAQKYVDFSGALEVDGEPATALITFELYNESFKITTLKLDGTDAGNIMLRALLEKVYESYDPEYENEQMSTDFETNGNLRDNVRHKNTQTNNSFTEKKDEHKPLDFASSNISDTNMVRYIATITGYEPHYTPYLDFYNDGDGSYGTVSFYVNYLSGTNTLHGEWSYTDKLDIVKIALDNGYLCVKIKENGVLRVVEISDNAKIGVTAIDSEFLTERLSNVDVSPVGYNLGNATFPVNLIQDNGRVYSEIVLRGDGSFTYMPFLHGGWFGGYYEYEYMPDTHSTFLTLYVMKDDVLVQPLAEPYYLMFIMDEFGAIKYNEHTGLDYDATYSIY